MIAMTGRVKDFFWDQISGECPADEPGQEPDDLEILGIDAEQAWNRYLKAAEGQSTNGETP